MAQGTPLRSQLLCNSVAIWNGIGGSGLVFSSVIGQILPKVKLGSSMPSAAKSESFLRLVLVAPCATLDLAAATLASHLGISLAESRQRFAETPTTLCDGMDAPRARRLANLLGAMGAQVRLEAVSATAPNASQARFDLSIQPLEGDALSTLALGLSQWLPPVSLTGVLRTPARIEQSLAGLGGLILEALTQDEILQIRRALRRVGGLRLTVSNPANALFDLLQGHRLQTGLPTALPETLRRLGLAACKLTGAVAARLDRGTRDHILARFPAAGLVAMNRDFQRFDLFLTGARNVSPRELADFLVARSDLPRHLLERMPVPLRIESGLTRENALAFQADYAALGLETCARLRLYYPADCLMKDQVGQ